MEHKVRVGPAGWSYDDWKGIVYPEKAGTITFKGKGVVNALELKAEITGERVAVPASLIERYPRLTEIVREGQSAGE